MNCNWIELKVEEGTLATVTRSTNFHASRAILASSPRSAFTIPGRTIWGTNMRKIDYLHRHSFPLHSITVFLLLLGVLFFAIYISKVFFSSTLRPFQLYWLLILGGKSKTFLLLRNPATLADTFSPFFSGAPSNISDMPFVQADTSALVRRWCRQTQRPPSWRPVSFRQLGTYRRLPLSCDLW